MRWRAFAAARCRSARGQPSWAGKPCLRMAAWRRGGWGRCRLGPAFLSPSSTFTPPRPAPPHPCAGHGPQRAGRRPGVHPGACHRPCGTAGRRRRRFNLFRPVGARHGASCCGLLWGRCAWCGACCFAHPRTGAAHAHARLPRLPPAPPAPHGRTQVIYSHAQAKALHHAPLAIVLLLPLLGTPDGSQGLTFGGLGASTLLALASVLCALALPVAVGAGRAFSSGAPRGRRRRRRGCRVACAACAGPGR